MTSWTQIKEGLAQVNSQLTAGMTVKAEVIMNVITYLAAIIDVGSKIENDQSKMSMQAAVDIGEIRQKILMHNGAIEVLTKKTEKDHTGAARGILENKSATSLPMLGTDKNSFRNWNDRMVNVVVNLRYCEWIARRSLIQRFPFSATPEVSTTR